MRDVSSSPSRGGISSVTAGLASSAAVSSSSMPVQETHPINADSTTNLSSPPQRFFNHLRDSFAALPSKTKVTPPEFVGARRDLWTYPGQVWSFYKCGWHVSEGLLSWSQRTGVLSRTARWQDPSQTCHSYQPLPSASVFQWWNDRDWSPGVSLLPCIPLWSCPLTPGLSWSSPCWQSSHTCLLQCSMGK